MTEQEINEAVAKRLGWTKCEHPISLEGEIAIGWVRPKPIKQCFHEGLPHYSTDISAAYKLVEDCDFFGSKYEMGFWSFCEQDKGWLAEITDRVGGDISVEAETLPMAICLAFLKLSEVKV